MGVGEDEFTAETRRTQESHGEIKTSAQPPCLRGKSRVAIRAIERESKSLIRTTHQSVFKGEPMITRYATGATASVMLTHVAGYL